MCLKLTLTMSIQKTTQLSELGAIKRASELGAIKHNTDHTLEQGTKDLTDRSKDHTGHTDNE